MSGRRARRRGCWGRSTTRPGRKALRSATPSRRAWGAVASGLNKIQHGNAAQIEHYYNELTSGAEDYLAAGQTAAQWLGGAAAAYGLAGELGEGQMTAMLNGVDPTRLGEVIDGMAAEDMPPVVALAMRLVAGVEFSIGPDKTFSALWAIADARTRNMLLGIHREACDAVVRVLDTAAYVRRGAGGKQWQRVVGVLCAAVTHTTSRTGDPQLHDHFLIANIARAPDGKWLTLDGQLVYDMMQFAVTVYGRTLRYLATERLGLTWTSPDNSGHCHIVGVPEQLAELWAERSKQIRDFMDDHPEISNDRASAITRPDKDLRETYAEKIDRWRKEALKAVPEFAQRVIRGQFAAGPRGPATRSHLRPISPLRRWVLLRRAASAITARVAVWDRIEALQTFAEIVPDDCPIQEIEALADELMASDLVVDLGIPAGGGLDTNRPGGNRYATVELVAFEDAISQFFAGGADQVKIDPLDRDACEAMRFGEHSDIALDGEQLAAACGIAGGGQAHVLSGPAGTGKTYTLQAVARLARLRGVRIEALAPSQAAANLLGEHVGIEGVNVTRRLDDPRAFDMGAWCMVDEASMLPTHQLHQLEEGVKACGGKLILVGDPHQLSAVKGPQGMFRALANSGDVAHHQLSEVRRFSQPWEQQTSKLLRSGTVSALDTYAAHRRIRGTSHLPEWKHEERLAVAIKVVAAAAVEHIAAGDDVAITASRNDAVAALNTIIQRSLFPDRETRALRVGDGIVEVGVGDRIITRNNDFKIRTTSNTAIVNGSAWTVKSIEDNGDLRLSAVGRGGNVVLPADYIARDGSIQLGWASTVHVAQGRTADVGMTLIDDSTDLELLYVGATRGRHTNLIFGLGTDEEVLEAAKAAAGKVRAKLSATEAKDLATDPLGDRLGRQPAARSPRPPSDRRSHPVHQPTQTERRPTAPRAPTSSTRATGPDHRPISPRQRSIPRPVKWAETPVSGGPQPEPASPLDDAGVEDLARLALNEELVSLADTNSVPLDAPQHQQRQRRPLHATSQPPKPQQPRATQPPRPQQPRASQRPRKPPAQLRVSRRPRKPPQTVMEFVRRARDELTDLTQPDVDRALASIAGNPDAPDAMATQWAALAELNESAAARRLTQTEHPPELSSPKHPAQESQAIGLF